MNDEAHDGSRGRDVAVGLHRGPRSHGVPAGAVYEPPPRTAYQQPPPAYEAPPPAPAYQPAPSYQEPETTTGPWTSSRRSASPAHRVRWAPPPMRWEPPPRAVPRHYWVGGYWPDTFLTGGSSTLGSRAFRGSRSWGTATSWTPRRPRQRGRARARGCRRGRLRDQPASRVELFPADRREVGGQLIRVLVRGGRRRLESSWVSVLVRSSAPRAPARCWRAR